MFTIVNVFQLPAITTRQNTVGKEVNFFQSCSMCFILCDFVVFGFSRFFVWFGGIFAAEFTIPAKPSIPLNASERSDENSTENLEIFPVFYGIFIS